MEKFPCKEKGCEHRAPFGSPGALKIHQGWMHKPAERAKRLSGVREAAASGQGVATRRARAAAGVYAAPAASEPKVKRAAKVAAQTPRKLAVKPKRKYQRKQQSLPTDRYCRFCPRCGENIAIIDRLAAAALHEVTNG